MCTIVDMMLLINFLDENFDAFAKYCGSEAAAATLINAVRDDWGMELVDYDNQ